MNLGPETTSLRENGSSKMEWKRTGGPKLEMNSEKNAQRQTGGQPKLLKFSSASGSHDTCRRGEETPAPKKRASRKGRKVKKENRVSCQTKIFKGACSSNRVKWAETKRDAGGRKFPT